MDDTPGLTDIFDFSDLPELETVLQAVFAVSFVWILCTLMWTPRKRPQLRSAAVLVLGDVGRSPRMMYHAGSFARAGFETFVVGYEGAKPVAALLVEPKIRFCYLAQPPSVLRFLPFIALAPIKIVHQLLSILYTFFVEISEPPEFIIVQNPPSIPTLALVRFIALVRGCKVIIDWHNLGYTILALKLGDKHPLVRVARLFEATFGRTAYAHLFVTEAMHDHLVKEWCLRGRKAVLHDRPPAHFHRAQTSEVHELFLRLDGALKTQGLADFLPQLHHPYSTVLTEVLPAPGTPEAAGTTPSAPSANSAAPAGALGAPGMGAVQPAPLGAPMLREDRPALVVSSTSWTPDEDFGILLDALGQYERRARAVNVAGGKTRLPKALMVVTGKGPLKERYMHEIKRRQSGRDNAGLEPSGWQWVRCISLWLEPEDYPLLLGSADLGVCLHSSSSALDLPMKVVDMFGCGLPVCALDFACLGELVKEGQNGVIFSSAAQLASQLEALLTSFPECATLDGLRASLLDSSKHGGSWNSWTENWDQVVKPLVLSDISDVARFSSGM